MGGYAFTEEVIRMSEYSVHSLEALVTTRVSSSTLFAGQRGERGGRHAGHRGGGAGGHDGAAEGGGGLRVHRREGGDAHAQSQGLDGPGRTLFSAVVRFQGQISSLEVFGGFWLKGLVQQFATA